MATEFQTVLTQVSIMLGIGVTLITPIIAYVRNKFNCLKDLRNDFEEFKDQYGDRQLRHSKAFIILSQRLDMANARQHPDRSPLNLGPDIETILKDKDGNL